MHTACHLIKNSRANSEINYIPPMSLYGDKAIDCSRSRKAGTCEKEMYREGEFECGVRCVCEVLRWDAGKYSGSVHMGGV